MEKSLDGPLPKWCPAVALSRQDGHHSAVALLLKAALIQVSDYRLLGASGISKNVFINYVNIWTCPLMPWNKSTKMDQIFLGFFQRLIDLLR
jgi:hypothetical protein